MKKLLFLLLGAFSLFELQAQEWVVKRDSFFTNVYYRTHASTLNSNKSIFDASDGNFTFSFHSSFFPVLIAWDLNGVIFKKEYSLTANLYQIAVTEGHGWIYTFKTLASFGKLWRYKTQLKKEHDPRGYVWDAMFRTLETSDQGKKFAELLRRFSQQANLLDYDTVSILQELSANGHHNVILSNMGEGLVDINANFLRRQLEKNTLTKNQRAATEFAINLITNKRRNTIASQNNNWLHKPMRKSYETCLQKSVPFSTAPHEWSLTIFIDDKVSNVIAAVDEGLFDLAVLFTTPKDLRDFLNCISNGQISMKQQEPPYSEEYNFTVRDLRKSSSIASLMSTWGWKNKNITSSKRWIETLTE